MIDTIGDFAFLLTTGDVVHFATIAGVRQDVTGALWIDVMLTDPPVSMRNEQQRRLWKVAAEPADRGFDGVDVTATIRADHIVAAVDLTDDARER
jgi:hypothetical protein